MRAVLDVGGTPHDVELVKADGGWRVEVDGESFEVRLERNGSGVLLRIGDRTLHVELGAAGLAKIDGHATRYRIQEVSGTARQGPQGADRAMHVRPPMNGKLERLLVSAGQTVAKGDVLFVLEAMKMHNEVRAPIAGKVKALHVAAGATVEPRMVVLDLEPN